MSNTDPRARLSTAQDQHPPDSLPDRRALAALADELEAGWPVGSKVLRDAAAYLRAEAGRREAVEQLIEAGEAVARSLAFFSGYNDVRRHLAELETLVAAVAAVRAAGGEAS